MTATTITFYLVIKFVHVAAVVLAFGPTYGYPVIIGVGERKFPTAMPAILRGVMTTDRYLVTPGMLVLLAGGIYLVADNPVFKASTTFVSVGIVAIILLLGLVHGFFNPQTKRAAELAERDLAGGGELSDEYLAVSKRIANVGTAAGLVIMVTIFFMVVKP
jgi:uncharacterized membrane protein